MKRTTLSDFLFHHVIKEEGLTFLGVMSNFSEASTLVSSAQQLYPGALVKSVELNDPHIQIDVSLLLPQAELPQPMIWVVALPAQVLASQWTKLKAQEKKLSESYQHLPIVVVFNVFEMDSVYDVIPELREVAGSYYNLDVIN